MGLVSFLEHYVVAYHLCLLIIMADSDRKWHVVVAVVIAVTSSVSGCSDASALMLSDSLCGLSLASEYISV